MTADKPLLDQFGRALMPVQLYVAGVAAGPSNGLPTSSVSRVVDAPFTPLTRPANVTPYSALKSISNSATAGSVSALEATVADVADAPLTLCHVKLETTDTGFAGAQVRAYVYRADPTANSGVGAGDNAPFANKLNGLVGTFLGTLVGMSDGASGNLMPEDGAPLLCLPESGGRRLWIQYQIMTNATPAANSTTFQGRIKGYQARA